MKIKKKRKKKGRKQEEGKKKTNGKELTAVKQRGSRFFFFLRRPPPPPKEPDRTASANAQLALEETRGKVTADETKRDFRRSPTARPGPPGAHSH